MSRHTEVSVYYITNSNYISFTTIRQALCKINWFNTEVVNVFRTCKQTFFRVALCRKTLFIKLFKS